MPCDQPVEACALRRVGTVLIWDLADPSVPVFSERFRERGTTALSPDGSRLYVAVADEQPLRVFDVDSGRPVRAAESAPLAAAGANSMELSPDGSTLAVATGSQVQFFDARTLQATGAALRGHTAAVNDVIYSGDGRLLVSASEDRSAIVWEAGSGAPLHRFLGQAGLRSAAFGADEGTVYATGGNGLILAWAISGTSRLLTLGEDADRGRRVYTQSLPAPDGHTVARVAAGTLWFEDTRSGRRSARSVPTRDTSFTWSPNSRWLVSNGNHGVVTVWDASSGAVAGRTTADKAEEAVLAAFSPDT